MPFLISTEKTITWKRESNNLLQFAEQNWKNGCFNDVTIEADNETIEANRMVLASGSLYFEKLFKTEMKEKYQPVVKLTDVNGGSVLSLIEFIYTGDIVTNNKNVLDLLSTADYLLIDKAKQFCFEFLLSVVTADTCFAILSVAGLYQHDQLKERALRCIEENFGEIQFNCDLSKNDLIVCISKMKENNVKESSIYQAIESWIKFDAIKRKQEFQELLFLINFERVPVDFIQEIMLSDELITEAVISMKYVINKFTTALRKQQKKNSKKTKVTSYGGRNTTKEIIEVYNYFNDPLTPPSHCEIKGYRCKFAGKIADNIYVCAQKLSRRGNLLENLCILKQTKISYIHWEQIAEVKEARFRAIIDEETWVDDYSQPRVKFYLPRMDAWIDGPELNEKRENCAFVSCKNCLYALGGSSANNSASSSAEKLETTGLLKNGKWRYIQPMQKPRMNFAAVNCAGVIYVIGGDSGQGTMKSAEKYNPTTNEWSYISDMKVERQNHAACEVDGKIIVVGGTKKNKKHVFWYGFNNAVAVEEIECYDPSEDTWSAVGKIEHSLYDHCLVVS